MTATAVANAPRLRAALYFVGLLAAQRFTFPTLSAYACLIPLLLLAVPMIRARHAFTVMLIALLASVDLGGEVYAETPGVLRYLLYAVLATALLKGKRCFGRYRDIVLILYLGLLVVNTFTHPHALNGYSFSKDLITVLLGYTVYFHFRPEEVQPLEYGLLGWFCAGMITAELLNIVFIYQLSSGEYLNYSSFKFLVVAPCLYLLLNRKYVYAVIVGALTLMVLANYASRILMLSFLGTALLILVRDLFKVIKLSTALFMASIIAVACMFVESSMINLEAFRAFTVLAILSGDLSIDVLRLMDPVRFIENSIFFGQDTYSLLFGNGLGSGIFDANGDFAFIPDDGAAFSSKELSESHFFRLHDSWTWFGYRFGLLPYLLFVGIALKGLLSHQPRKAIASAMMLLAMLNSTFSVGGLFICAAFALQYRREAALQSRIARGSNLGMINGTFSGAVVPPK